MSADSWRADAGWIVVVLAAICAGLHVWDLPAAIPFIRHQMAITLVQAGTLLGVVQVAGMAGGLAVSLFSLYLSERRLGITLAADMAGRVRAAASSGHAAPASDVPRRGQRRRRARLVAVWYARLVAVLYPRLPRSVRGVPR